MSEVSLLVKDILDERKPLSDRITSARSLEMIEASELSEFASLLINAVDKLSKRLLEKEAEVTIYVEFLKSIRKIFGLLDDKNARKMSNILIKSLRLLTHDVKSSMMLIDILRSLLKNKPSQIFIIRDVLKELLKLDTYDYRLKRRILKLIRDVSWLIPNAIREFRDVLSELINDPKLSEDSMNIYFTVAGRNFRVVASDILTLLKRTRDITRILEILSSYATFRADAETLARLYNKVEKIATNTSLEPNIRASAVRALAAISREKDKIQLQDNFSAFIRTHLKLEEDLLVKTSMIEALRIIRWYSEEIAGEIIDELLDVLTDEAENSQVRRTALGSLIYIILSYPTYAANFLSNCLKIIHESVDEELKRDIISSLPMVCPLVPEKFNDVASELISIIGDDEQPYSLRVESISVLNRLSDKYPSFARRLTEFSDKISHSWFNIRSAHIKNEIVNLISNIHKHTKELPADLIEVVINAFILPETYVAAHNLAFILSKEIPKIVAQYVDKILEFPLLISSILTELVSIETEKEYLLAEMQERIEEPVRNYFRILGNIYEYLSSDDRLETIESIINTLSLGFHEAIIPTIVNEALFILKELRSIDPATTEFVRKTIEKVKLPRKILEKLKKAGF